MTEGDGGRRPLSTALNVVLTLQTPGDGVGSPRDAPDRAAPGPRQTRDPALPPPHREPGKTKLVTFFQTDLSGLLPQSVVDAFFPRSMAGFYANLQRALRSVPPAVWAPPGRPPGWARSV